MYSAARVVVRSAARHRALAQVVLPLVVVSQVLAAVPGRSASERRQLRAVPRQGVVHIDGQLDEPAWQAAEETSGFVQTYPDPGTRPVHDTRVRVLFDDRALYVAARCLDDEPGRIEAKLLRRDDGSESDRFTIYLDSRHDRRSGFWFKVNAANVQSDGTLYDENWQSSDWDGVWESAVAVVGDGYQVEMRIPLSLLRYQPGDDVHMGLDFSRRHSRHNQNSSWQYEPPGTGRMVSAYGTLVGLTLPHAPLALEATPYLALRALHGSEGWVDDSLSLVDTGVDVKLGLLGNLSLVGTINPDFGQVEADPAVLNLSTVETYYPEKRPFFLEDRELFQRPSGLGNEAELFYSRRIGRASRYPDLRDGEELLREAPPQRILGATKVVGRTDGGLTVGGLQAFTGNSLATVQGPLGVVEHRVAEPAASYSALRLKQSFLENASAGVMGTALATVDQGAAFAGGADMQADWNGFRATALGHLSALTAERLAWQDDDTRAALERDGLVGHGATLTVERTSSDLLVGGAGASYRSPNLALDDMGYLDRADQIAGSGWLQLRRLKPLGPVVRANLNASAWIQTNTAGLPLSQAADALLFLDFSNNWGGYAYSRVAAASCDDRETRSRGTVAVCEQFPDAMAQLFAVTDARARLYVQAWVAGGNSERGFWLQSGGTATLQLTSWVKLDLSPGFNQNTGSIRWLTTEDTPRGPRYLFAVTGTQTMDLTARGSLLVSPTLSFQLYSQLFHYTVDYRDKLRAPRVVGGRILMADLVAARDVEDGYDASLTSLQLNAVLRWEYQPGSVLFVVYTTAISEGLDRARVAATKQLQDLQVSNGEHALMIKLSYRLGS